MLVVNLKSKSQVSHTIGKCIGWNMFFFLEGVSFRSKCQALMQLSTNTSVQRTQAAHEVLIPSSVPAEACVYPPGSWVFRGKQCYLLGKKSSRVLDEPVQLQNSRFPVKSRIAWHLLLKVYWCLGKCFTSCAWKLPWLCKIQ